MRTKQSWNNASTSRTRRPLASFVTAPSSSARCRYPINGHLAHLDKAAIGTLWAPVDAVFMDAMEELIVIDEPGWKESAGVAREIEFFRQRDRRVSLWSDAKGEFPA